MATYKFAETGKVEGKLDTLVNLVTQIAVSQKSASIARVFGIRVHDMAIYTSDETGKLEGKLDALVNLVTQLAVNQIFSSVARVFGIRSSNDHHTDVYLSLQQSGVNEHLHAYAISIYSRPPQQEMSGT
ncbi:hypothetical protein Fmac_008367 [Flemingia macrophylla]|uniref:Uncharacterized protein n=1 Tax=Flemingia macrophylla TaxID=520843 RepID=A0ABD1MY18_9FABA